MNDDVYRADVFGLHGELRSAATPRNFYDRFGKRTLDLTCASILLLLAMPVMTVVLIGLIWSGMKPFFAHERVGRDHKTFRCLKFQTMREDSARVLRFVLRTDPDAAEEWAESQKLLDDPRVTRLGLFLRKTSLDELPQLINVLRGEMSMVGPRPVTEKELSRYGSNLPHYLAARPGLTGLWQIYGRGTTSFDERVQMDCAYVRDISFLTDIKLILRTAEVVLKRSGS